jgi:hypothetical protein
LQLIFYTAVNKLKDNPIFKFDYTKYRSHESASVEMFKKLAHGKFESMDNIDQQNMNGLKRVIILV